jgi:hypothetical protein
MKKTLSVIALSVMIVTSFSSCKKDWACECTDQNGSKSSSTISDETLLNARNQCQAKDYDYTTGGVHVSRACTLN